MSITKEQTFELLKDTIITLKDKGKELRSSTELHNKWREQKNRVEAAIKECKEEDMKWMEQEYSKWFEICIKPEIKKRNLNTMGFGM